MSRHLKSQAAPKSWTLLRKINKWTVRPMPGAHPLESSIPIAQILKKLEFAQNMREIKKIIVDKNVSVDGNTVFDHHTSVGLMDIFAVKPETTMRVSIDAKGRLILVPIKENESNKKVCKIVGKKTVRGGKVQLNLLDGRNIIADKKEYSVGDSLLIEVPSQKIIAHYKLEKGMQAFLYLGKHIGTTAEIQSISEDKIVCIKDKTQIETLKKFAIVIGDSKPSVTL